MKKVNLNSMDKKDMYPFFEKEMTKNADLYVDNKTNQFIYTWLGEAYLEQHEVKEEDEEAVFESVIDWFEQWDGKFKYNN